MSAVPPGWSHNPTSWRRRGPLIALAALGFAIALYLGLYQLSAYGYVWDPIFGGEHSKDVLDLISPIPDALLGVIAYSIEIALLIPGGEDRWRTLPLVCLALGVVLIVGGVVSVALIAIQATVAQSWCTLCLGSAAVSFTLLAFGIGEARAALQHIRREAARGRRPAAPRVSPGVPE